MDYLLALIASLLFPYTFNASNIDYTVNFGVKGSMQQFTSYKLKLLYNNGDTTYEIIDVSPVTANYGIRPEFFVEYPIYIKKLWVAPTIGWEPLFSELQYKYKAVGSDDDSASTAEVYYNKTPYIGLNLGYTLKYPNQYNSVSYFNSLGFTPYISASIGRVYYADSGSYPAFNSYSYRYTLGGGLKVDFKDNWSLYMQYQTFNFDESEVSESHPVSLTERQIQVGVAYVFKSRSNNDKLRKINSYSSIIKDLETPKVEEKSTPSINVVNQKSGIANILGTTPSSPNNNKVNNAQSSTRSSAIKKTNEELKKAAETRDIKDLPTPQPDADTEDFGF